MISVIICSRTANIKEDFLVNIQSTIGYDYELIVIDNSENSYSIFEAYNIGIKKSKGDYLCFIHDDIFFHTQGWGRIIDEIFSIDEKIGLIGVAGAKIKTKMPSGWWSCPERSKEVNILQHLSDGLIEKWEIGSKNESLCEVVVLDGVFMVMKKSTNIIFNTKLKGFHNYDLNISLECILHGYKVMVTKEILIEHFSIGTINKAWYHSAIEFYQCYKNKLPLKTTEISNSFCREHEFKNGSEFITAFLNSGFELKIFRIWFSLWLIKPFDKFHLNLIKKLKKRMSVKLSNFSVGLKSKF